MTIRLTMDDTHASPLSMEEHFSILLEYQIVYTPAPLVSANTTSNHLLEYETDDRHFALV